MDCPPPNLHQEEVLAANNYVHCARSSVGDIVQVEGVWWVNGPFG